jgi:hypothetical protein
MSRRIINVGGSFLSLNPQTIFGENLYDWFDFTDNDTLELSGVRIDAINSKAIGSTRAFVSSGGARPQVVTDQINGLQVGRLDGVSEFMHIQNSTALYNFLHNQEDGGVIITIQKLEEGSAVQSILANAVGGDSIGMRHEILGITCVRGVIFQQTYIQTYDLTPFDNKFSSLINVVDPKNSTALDRVSTIINGVTTTPNNSITNTPSNNNASQDLTLGRRPGNNDRYFKGDIPEIILVKGQPTNEELTKTSIYINKKYGDLPV